MFDGLKLIKKTKKHVYLMLSAFKTSISSSELRTLQLRHLKDYLVVSGGFEWTRLSFKAPSPDDKVIG